MTIDRRPNLDVAPTFRAIIDAVQAGMLPATWRSSSPTGKHEWARACRAVGIEALFRIRKTIRAGGAYDEAVADVLAPLSTCSPGLFRHVGVAVDAFHGRILNVHPSLPPVASRA